MYIVKYMAEDVEFVSEEFSSVDEALLDIESVLEDLPLGEAISSIKIEAV